MTYLGIKVTNGRNQDIHIVKRHRDGKNTVSVINVILWYKDVTKTFSFIKIVKYVVAYGSNLGK